MKSTESQDTPPISHRQAAALVDNVPWIDWSVTADENGLGNKAIVNLRPRIKPDLPALSAKTGSPFSSWLLMPLVFIFGIGALLISTRWGIAILIFLAFAALGSIFQAVTTAPGLIVIASIVAAGAVSFALDARRNHYIKTVQIINIWLNDANIPSDSIEREWFRALPDSATYRLIVRWILSGREIDELKTHIDQGVQLRKHLSPQDPRRRTMQVEIDTQRSKLDQLASLREEQADYISDTAQSYLAEKKRVRDEEQNRVQTARENQRRHEEHQRRIQEIRQKEYERVETQEQVDKWLDGSR